MHNWMLSIFLKSKAFPAACGRSKWCLVNNLLQREHHRQQARLLQLSVLRHNLLIDILIYYILTHYQVILSSISLISLHLAWSFWCDWVTLQLRPADLKASKLKETETLEKSGFRSALTISTRKQDFRRPLCKTSWYTWILQEFTHF